MNTNQKAILCYIKKGATLHVSNDNRVASVIYPDGRNIPVNADAAVELIEDGVLSEMIGGGFVITQSVTA